MSRFDSPAPGGNPKVWLGHPPGLFLLFLVEMWERFSYYGMRALLVLYLISVFAPHQLPTGAYRNTLVVKESSVAPDGTETPIGIQTRDVVLAIGGAAPADDTKSTRWEPAETPRLVIERLAPPLDKADPWAPVSVDGAIVLKGDASRKFDATEVRFAVTNPGPDPIKLVVEIAEDPQHKHTYITVNDSPSGAVTVLQPGDKPFEVKVHINEHDSGRNWTTKQASTLYGWYTGLAYLFPILGGLIADKLIGTHRSMLIGGILISIGHVILGASGWGNLAYNESGMSLFIAGLAVIILGTGHFKPTVSVMVGQLYPPGDPRRDGAFTIFYMGINLGAFLCAFVCGSLGEMVGWHWGFGAAAVGMLLGLGIYLVGRPFLLKGIGDPPEHMTGRASGAALGMLVANLILAALVGLAYHAGATAKLGEWTDALIAKPVLATGVIVVMVAAILTWVGWFLAINRPEDRGPVITIFVFMLFNAFFWIAFEQAGSSINVFTEQKTDRSIALPGWFRDAFSSPAWTSSIVFILIGFVGTVASFLGVVRRNRAGAYKSASACVFGAILSIGILAVGILKPIGLMQWLTTFNEIPATWFQSVNAGLIFILAPIFAGIWTFLGNRRMNPSQPVKIALGLIFLGLGYIFMVWAGQIAVGGAAKAGMFLIFMTYLWHTVGELCLSPTGLSYVTKAAPLRFVSLLMGIWFISSFIANLGGGLVAAQVEAIEKGTLKLPWNFGGQADFFFLFVVTSIGAGVVILIFSPLLKKLTGGRG